MPEAQGGSLRLHGPIGTGPPRAGWPLAVRDSSDRYLKFACASGPGTVAPLTVTATGSSKLEARTPCLRIGRSPAPVLAGSLSEHSRPECQCSEGTNCQVARLGVHVRLARTGGPTARARRSLRLAVGFPTGSVRTSDRKRLSVVELAHSLSGTHQWPGHRDCLTSSSHCCTRKQQDLQLSIHSGSRDRISQYYSAEV